MPVEILTAAQRAEWERFPDEIDERALARCFSFPDSELSQIVERKGAHLRFAIAATVGTLRWLGFVPATLSDLPAPAAALVAGQLDVRLSGIDPARLVPERHARAEQTAAAMAISGFRSSQPDDLNGLRDWLSEGALEREAPRALLVDAVDRLRRRQIVRPGLTVLERLVATAREHAEREIHRRVKPKLTMELISGLDELVQVPDHSSVAPIKAFGQETRSLARIGEPLGRLEVLRALGVESWDLAGIPANRQRMLARYVRHATSLAC